MRLAAHRTPTSSVALVALALVAVSVALLWSAAGARGADLLYWNNYKANPTTIGSSNIDGSAGGLLNLGGVELGAPEGMAIDSATGRLFVTDYGDKKVERISFYKLDGSGGGVLSAPGAPIVEPEGLTIDPATRTLYWLNTKSPETISWAKLDGSGGGLLNTTGAVLEGAYRLTIDTAGGRVLWGNSEASGSSIGYARVDGSGGGDLSLAGATPPSEMSGLAVDSIAKRVYWVDHTSGSQKVSYASLSGGGGGDVSLTGAILETAYGLAVDPTLSRLYWGNYDEKAPTAFSFLGTGGGGSTLGIVPTPVEGPQDPQILKSPSGAGAPAVTQNPSAKTSLTCSQGSWGADFPGSFTYQAPSTFAYQWTNKGAPVPGATSSALTATSAGEYSCVVTAGNQAGTAAQTSAAVTVKAASFKLKTKKKSSVKAGKSATFKISATNQGDLEPTKKAKVCAKLPKKAKKAGLKAPKCKPLGKANAKGQQSATLKVKVGAGTAPGTYKLSFKVSGIAGPPAKAKIVVSG